MSVVSNQNTLVNVKKSFTKLSLFTGKSMLSKKILGDKRILECILNLGFTSISLLIVSTLLHSKLEISVVLIIYSIRRVISFLLFDDYKLSWSKASLKTGNIKTINGFLAFCLYVPILLFFKQIPVSLLLFDLTFYLSIERTSLFVYKYYKTRALHQFKLGRKAVIYGAGTAGVVLKNELCEMVQVCWISQIFRKRRQYFYLFKKETQFAVMFSNIIMHC